jgi:hypothetical protein
MSNNGANPAIGEGVVAAPVGDPAVICLEHALAAAKAGRINTVGIIMVDAGGNVSPAWGGSRLGDVHLGCALMQFRLMTLFTQPQNQSRIWRPPPGMAG